jgi:hypothetical protein
MQMILFTNFDEKIAEITKDKSIVINADDFIY